MMKRSEGLWKVKILMMNYLCRFEITKELWMYSLRNCEFL